jgi:hypothetical protein
MRMTTFVTDLTREFVASGSDFDRSAAAGGVAVIVLIVLLIERELIASDGRREPRALTAFSIPFLAMFVVLIVVRVEILLR